MFVCFFDRYKGVKSVKLWYIGRNVEVKSGVGNSDFLYLNVPIQISEYFEWNEWLQICKKPIIQIFYVIDFGRLNIPHKPIICLKLHIQHAHAHL